MGASRQPWCCDELVGRFLLLVLPCFPREGGTEPGFELSPSQIPQNTCNTQELLRESASFTTLFVSPLYTVGTGAILLA